MFRHIYSWCKGLKVGQHRFIHDRPLFVSERYGVRCQTWDGFKWVTGPRTEVTRQVYENLGVLNVVAH